MTIRATIVEVLKRNPQGMYCGEVAAALTKIGIPQKHTTMTVHLNHLQKQGKIHGVFEGFKKRYFAGKAKAGTVRQSPPATSATPASSPAPQPPSVTSETASQVIGSLSGSIDSLADQIAQAVAGAFRVRLEQAVQAQVNAVMASLPAKLALPPPDFVAETPEPKDPAVPRHAEALRDSVPVPAIVDAPKKLRVTVFGLLDGQAAMIDHEFGKDLDLRFVRSDDAAGQRAKQLASNSDHVITMVGFISHAVEDMVRSRGGNLTRVSGGMSALRDALTRLYVEE